MAVQRERQRAEAEHVNRNLAAAVVTGSSESAAVEVSRGRRSQRCRSCGQAENGAAPGGRGATGR